MPQLSKLQKDKLTFMTSANTTGEISYDETDNKFNFDRVISANGGM